MSASASIPTNNAPAEATRFVGRRRELTHVKRLFTHTRLVTLTGVGGVGKTRIAVRLAHTMSRELRDGACFVPLAELYDGDLLGHAVAEMLGLREHSERTALDTLTAHLADKQLLLVLDNCEHLLEACAALAGSLLAACPRLWILTTSREPLMIAGESTLSVPPMSTPGTDPVTMSELPQYDAVNLFLDRATSAVPDFRLTEDNYAMVASLCQTLDGLPLALELAAVRLRALSLDQILTRLTDRYSLLTAGSRNAPARQQTLRALITWSYDLCSPDEQLLWARLSVFSGGVELDAAETICSDERLPSSAIFGLLASLVDKSILIRDEQAGHVRYRLLETIRQYGAEQLTEAGEWPTWQARHRDFYAETITKIFANWVGEGQADSVGRLRRDHANIRVALEFCSSDPRQAGVGLSMAGSLYLYWITRGLVSEGRHWLEQLLARYEGHDEQRTRALYVASSLAAMQGSSTTATELLDQADTIARSTNDRAGLAYIAQARAFAALVMDDQATAVDLFRESLRYFERAHDDSGRYLTLTLLGLTLTFIGDHDGVESVFEECRELSRPTGEEWHWSYCLCAVGFDAWQRGDNERAADHFRKSLQIKRTFDDRLGLAECIEGLACVESAAKRYERAATLVGAAESIWRKLGISLAHIPALARYRDQCVSAAHHIGERPYRSAFQRGLEMTLDEAIGYVLDKQPAAPIGEGTELRLTPREKEVALLVGRGLTNRDIAGQLSVSRRTVEGHVEHVMAKLGFTSRTQIAAWVARCRPESDSAASILYESGYVGN
ncbi:ATP-binding protein [Nocardia aobensis]|uniref:ATP-binding protein n=1 Tax=Nocardia aobensis TaxID=257277 RepID=A0ABW6PFT2_9NOCA